MHILSMIRHREKAPTNALIAQAVRSCAERGIPYLWYAAARMAYVRESLTWEAKAQATTRILRWAVKQGPKSELPPPKTLRLQRARSF
jgi:hypothetical protein